MTTIPSIQAINDDILSDLTTEFDVTLNPLGLAFLTALAGVLSGLFWLIYLYLGDIQRDEWYSTCSPSEVPRWGFEILGRYQFQATAGVYTATVTGTTGGIIPADAVFKANDSSTSPGKLYLITGGTYVLPGSTGTINIQALAGGVASRLETGDTLTATAPLTNANSVITITVEVTAPVNAEGIEDYRLKIREKVQLLPGSWSATDYRLIGIEIAGVFQTYAYADSGSSSVVNVFLQGDTPGTPIGGSIITAYETALEVVLPLGVWTVNYAASPQKAIAITITMGTFTAFTTAQKALIETALSTFINSVHPYIAGAGDTVDERNDVIATFNLNATISAAVPGYGFSAVTFTVAGTPSTNWLADNGETPYYAGPVTYA